MTDQLLEDDAKYIWHPFTQMKTAPVPIAVKSASGVIIKDTDGNEYIDGVSSWWVNIHGHSHPYIAQKLFEQAQELEHVIFAGFTHKPAVELGRRLSKYTPEKHKRIFFSDNGSTAVEVGIKMAIQFLFNSNQTNNKEKPLVISLNGAYHGDTFGSMSVSARSAFSEPFHQFLFDSVEIPAPVPGKEAQTLKELKQALESAPSAILIYEPLVQGAGGMCMYSPEAMEAMLRLAKQHNAVLIADEVMTGFYRTGTFFASDQVDSVKPDIMALSKGLTGGTMAMGVTSCSDEIYDAFLSNDYSKTFFHGHSFTANPLACTVSLASLDLTEKVECIEAVKRIGHRHTEFMERLAQRADCGNIRRTGTIIAFEWTEGQEGNSYFHGMRDFIYNYFIDRGILLRPLGNTIYIMPPYCISDEHLDKLYEGIIGCLDALKEASKNVELA